MRKRHFLTSFILGALVLGTVLLATSSRATPRAGGPSTYIGVSPQAPPDRDDLRLMRRTGVGSLRFLVYWAQIEPEPGVFDWSATDAFMVSTARHGFGRLPVVWGSPSWLSRTRRPGRCGFTAARCAALRMPIHSRAERRAWSGFLRALVARYGPAVPGRFLNSALDMLRGIRGRG
jgi:hypothetical protein